MATTNKLFSSRQGDIESLSEDDLHSMEGIVKSFYEMEKINAGIDVVSLLAETSIYPSKGEARKAVQGGAVSINRKKVDAVDVQILANELLYDKYLLIQKGKKNYYLLQMR